MSNYTNPQVDGVHMHLENKKIGRNFFWFIWIMYSLVYMTKYCFSSAMAPIVESGVLTKSQTGFIAASFHIVYAPLQILGGMFADRYNPERMIKIGLLGSAIANFVIFLNQNYYVMLFAWMFNAAVQFAIWPSVFKITASQLPRSEKPKNVFILSFSSAMGLLISFVVAAILPSWQLNFAFSSFVSLALYIVMHFVCKKVDRFMLPDRETLLDNIRERDSHGVSLRVLMISSGLILIIAVTLIRTMIGQGAQTLVPTMLMESYGNISASFGNVLSIIVIVSGMLGVFVVKFLVNRKFIKNEIAGMVGALFIMIPMCIAICMVGKVPYIAIVAAMSMISFCATAVSYMTSSYSSRFAAFGKDGTVAGLMNCAASAALIVQTYGFAAIADNFGWLAVCRLWLVLTVVATLLTIAALPIYIKFKKKYKDIL